MIKVCSVASQHPDPRECNLFLMLKKYGGEGGIRTPDRLAPMSDFESGAFNRALPPLRTSILHHVYGLGISDSLHRICTVTKIVPFCVADIHDRSCISRFRMDIPHRRFSAVCDLETYGKKGFGRQRLAWVHLIDKRLSMRYSP